MGRSLSSGLSLNPTDIDPLDRLAPPESPLEALPCFTPLHLFLSPTIIPPHKVFDPIRSLPPQKRWSSHEHPFKIHLLQREMARQQSLDSERPIMTTSNRNSKRFSTVSGSPSLAASERTIGSLPSGDPRVADIHHLGDGLERLENKPLQAQRFVPTTEKSDNLNKLALGAKVERALGRRMTGQDAVMRKPELNEKAAANTST